MEKLTNREQVIKMLENVLAVEKEASRRYTKDASIINNERFKNIILSIEKDEERHAEMIEGLLTMLKKGESN